jgi:hypothetical protein
MKFTVANMTMITQTEIYLSFGFKEFLTNVGGFLGLYVGCSVISIFEIFYFIFKIFCQKLMRKNQVKKINFNQNQGLTLAEIFDLENFSDQ